MERFHYYSINSYNESMHTRSLNAHTQTPSPVFLQAIQNPNIEGHAYLQYYTPQSSSTVMQQLNLAPYTAITKLHSPDQLVHPHSDGVEFSNRMTEQVFVLSHARVALNEAFGEVVDKQPQRVICGLEALQHMVTKQLTQQA